MCMHLGHWFSCIGAHGYFCLISRSNAHISLGVLFPNRGQAFHSPPLVFVYLRSTKRRISLSTRSNDCCLCGYASFILLASPAKDGSVRKTKKEKKHSFIHQRTGLFWRRYREGEHLFPGQDVKQVQQLNLPANLFFGYLSLPCSSTNFCYKALQDPLMLPSHLYSLNNFREDVSMSGSWHTQPNSQLCYRIQELRLTSVTPCLRQDIV